MRRPATSCALRLSWSSVGSHWSETRAHRSRSRRSRRRAATAVRSPTTGSPTKSASASRTSPATIRALTVRNSRTPPEGERSPAPAAVPTMPSSAQLVFRRVALVGDPRSQEQIQKEQEESGDSGEESDDGLTDEERKRIEDLTGDDSGSDGQEQQDPSGGGEVARAGSGADDA